MDSRKYELPLEKEGICKSSKYFVLQQALQIPHKLLLQGNL